MENEVGELTLVDLVVIQDDKHLASEVLYEIVEPELLVVSDVSVPYVALNEENSLDGYSEHQRENWSESDIIIYENEMQLRNFIKSAINPIEENKNSSRKMYFGRIPKNLAERIKKETGINVEGYNLSISAYEIRKIFKDHGNESSEFPRGQRAIVEDDIVNIPHVIQNPDKTMLSSTPYRGRNTVLLFVKTINGRTTVVSYVSKKSHDLAVQTMYSGKKVEPLPRG